LGRRRRRGGAGRPGSGGGGRPPVPARRPAERVLGGPSGPGVAAQLWRISRARRAVSLGVLPTLTPAASRASFFASAVPEEPETIAPAWPIVLPSGAVKPAT